MTSSPQLGNRPLAIVVESTKIRLFTCKVFPQFLHKIWSGKIEIISKKSTCIARPETEKRPPQ